MFLVFLDLVKRKEEEKKSEENVTRWRSQNFYWQNITFQSFHIADFLTTSTFNSIWKTF